MNVQLGGQPPPWQPTGADERDTDLARAVVSWLLVPAVAFGAFVASAVATGPSSGVMSIGRAKRMGGTIEQAFLAINLPVWGAVAVGAVFLFAARRLFAVLLMLVGSLTVGLLSVLPSPQTLDGLLVFRIVDAIGAGAVLAGSFGTAFLALDTARRTAVAAWVGGLCGGIAFTYAMTHDFPRGRDAQLAVLRPPPWLSGTTAGLAALAVCGVLAVRLWSVRRPRRTTPVSGASPSSWFALLACAFLVVVPAGFLQIVPVFESLAGWRAVQIGLWSIAVGVLWWVGYVIGRRDRAARPAFVAIVVAGVGGTTVIEQVGFSMYQNWDYLLLDIPDDSPTTGLVVAVVCAAAVAVVVVTILGRMQVAVTAIGFGAVAIGLLLTAAANLSRMPVHGLVVVGLVLVAFGATSLAGTALLTGSAEVRLATCLGFLLSGSWLFGLAAAAKTFVPDGDYLAVRRASTVVALLTVLAIVAAGALIWWLLRRRGHSAGPPPASNQPAFPARTDNGQQATVQVPVHGGRQQVPPPPMAFPPSPGGS